MEDLELRDLLLILKRRRTLFLLVAGGLFALSCLFAMTWSRYQSSATVEIAQSEISDNVAEPSGVNGNAMAETLADLRISRLQQKVLATGSIVDIITKFNLYAKARKTTPIADLADAFRNKVKINLVGSSLANPASAQKAGPGQLAAIAFTVGFTYGDPLIAQQVTNELVSRFLDEDLKEKKNQAKETMAFLESQLKGLEGSLKEQEEQIAAFRREHGDVRPETLGFNQQSAASTMMGLQNIESQLSSNLGTQGALRAQLAMTDPYSRVLGDGQVLTTPTIQLKALQSNFATLSAKYGPHHPDVIKAKRQIEALEAQTGGGGNTAVLQATLLDAKGRLETAQKTYGAENPEVVSLNKQVKGLEAQLAAEKAKAPANEFIKRDADNPVYLQIVAQLKATEEQYRALSKQKASLLAEHEKYQKAIIENPAVEQKMAELTRNYDNAQARYRDLQAKKMTASMVATIDEDRSGQRLIVIDPPELPFKTKPSRLVFVAAGFLFSLLGGLAAVIGKQLLKQSVVGAHHLETLLGVAPLIIIPHLSTEAEHATLKRRGKILALAASGATVLLLIVFSYAVMPLDVLGAVVARKLGFGG